MKENDCPQKSPVHDETNLFPPNIWSTISLHPKSDEGGIPKLSNHFSPSLNLFVQQRKSKDHFVFCWYVIYLVKPPLVWVLCARVYSCYPMYPLYPGLHGKQSKAMVGNCQGRFQPLVSSSDGQGTVISPAPLPRHRLWDGAQAPPAKVELTEVLLPNYLKISRSIIIRMFTKINTKLSINNSTKNSACMSNAGGSYVHTNTHQHANTPNN